MEIVDDCTSYSYHCQRYIELAKMPKYVLRMSMEHPTFRIPNLLSVAQTYGFPLKFISQDLSRGIMVVELEKEEDVGKLLDRGILILSVLDQFSQRLEYQA
jgi:tRNA (guanine10-N2)-methyltransferase